MKKIFGSFFYSLAVLQLVAAVRLIERGGFENAGWSWVLPPLQLYLFALPLLYIGYRFFEVSAPPASLEKKDPLPQTPPRSPAVPSRSLLPPPKPVQLSLGVASGPQQELFHQPPPEPSEIRYELGVIEPFMLDGEPPTYGDPPKPSKEPVRVDPKLPPGTTVFKCGSGHCEMTVGPASKPRPQQPLPPKKASKARMEFLTQGQKHLLEIYARRWAGMAGSHDPVDRDKAEEAVRWVYEGVGLKPPDKIIWCGSPAVAMASITLSRSLEKKRFLGSDAFLRKAYQAMAPLSPRAAWPRLWRDILYGIDEAGAKGLGDSCHEQTQERPMNTVGTILGEYFTRDFHSYVCSRFKRPYKLLLRRAYKANNDVVTGASHGQMMFIMDRLHEAKWGSREDSFETSYRDLSHPVEAMESYWYGSFDFLGEVMGLEKVLKPLRGWFQLVKNCGFVWTFEKTCWVTERPSFIHRDPLGFFHSGTGLAVGYPDGWGFRCRHGVPVEEKGPGARP